MDTDSRMSLVEAERAKWFERCITDGVGDLEYELTSAENKNTKRKTETDMRIFSSFLLNMNEERAAETIDAEELDRYLTTFFSVIKKHDGNEYEAASLRGMLCSIERYLRARNYPRSLTRDIVFIGTRNTLRDRQVVLREIAKSSKKSKQEMLTASSIEKLKQLYKAREFGPYNPMAVINTLCFAFVVHLKIRKAIDHKQLLWGDIVLKTQNSREYLCYDPVQGRDFLRQRLGNISNYRIYSHCESTSPADPVAVYKLYASKRPSQAMTPDSPFYLGLAVNGQTVNHHPQWFKCSPMGVNKLNDLVRMIREITGNLTMSISGSVNSIMDTYSSKYQPINNGSMINDSNIRENSITTDEYNTRSDSHPDTHDMPRMKHYNTHVSSPNNREMPVFDGPTTDSYPERTDRDLSPTRSTASADDGAEMGGDKRYTHQTETTESKLDKIKQKLADLMDALEEEEKEELTDWFTRSYSSTDNACPKCDTPRHFNIRFTWRNCQSDALATVHAIQPGNVELTANSDKIQGTREPNIDTVERPDEHEATSTKQNSLPDRDYVLKINRYESENDTCNSVSPSLAKHKRKTNDEYSHYSKMLRTQEVLDKNDCSSEITDNEENKAKQLNGLAKYQRESSETSSTAGDCCTVCRKEPERMPQWFTPWTFDPRLAFYLRHGLVAPYANCQNFASSKDLADA